MLNSNHVWVAVMTRPGAETAVAERFRENVNPIECYLPMLAVRTGHRKNTTVTEEPMFPHYLFAHINDKQVYQTRTTHGVIYIVSANHSIIQVPDHEIEAVRRFEASQRKIHFHETSQLIRGAKATILEGEFAGMEGTLVKNCKDGNFCVSIEVMNVSIVVRVNRNELKPKTKKEGDICSDAPSEE